MRYVLNAASGLGEDFHPPRDGFIQNRARQVLTETVNLLGEIEQTPARNDASRGAPLLDAIGRGTFGSMKRPADRGKGGDGVAVKAPDFFNPAIEQLEADGWGGQQR